MLYNAEIVPGSIALAWFCTTLLGSSHVDPGEWTTPVYVYNVSDDELDTIVELAKEKGVTINVQNKRGCVNGTYNHSTNN